MKYKTLRDILDKKENIDDILKLFRVNVENNITRLKQACNIDESDSKVPYEEWTPDEIEDFEYKWSEISSECIFNLYNKMGWDISKLVGEKNISYSSEADSAYVRYYLNDAWYEIKKLNNFEFLYAMIILIQEIYDNEKQKLYKYIKYPIEKFLSDYDLDNILKDKELTNVFIAMSFNEEMNDVREALMRSITNCGYNPIIMDLKEHNNQIVPEIFYEIKKSKFIVADLTQHKNGVYYEIGYAEALDKEIILCCRDNDYKKAHFDIAQMNIIKWSKTKELQEKLEKRIKVTIGIAY